MNDIPLFPVAAISVGPIKAYDAITIRLDFLSHATQKPEEAQTGRHYLLTPAQAQHVIEQISLALHQLGSGESQGTGLPKH